MTSASGHSIRIGPAGWSYKDWEGIVYPPHPSRVDQLGYLAHYFDTIEVNSSFYRIPPVTHARSWVKRTSFNDDFRFTVKLYKGFTHGEPESVDEARLFRQFLEPLQENHRLGAVLMQFPWSFKNDNRSMEKLRGLFGEFRDFPIALEVRHSSFQNADFLRFLQSENVSFVNIDQPLFSNSVKPSDLMSGPLAYVRFHGRNYEKWFAHEESWERYDYLYSQAELEPWVERIATMSEEKDVYAITNNHFRGQAIINAIDLKRSLGLPAEVPPPMVEMMMERGGDRK